MSRSRPSKIKDCPFVGKGGLKLQFALEHFGCQVENKIAADLGSHIGGFVDCLLSKGASKVYSVDTCYGTLAWKLRQNERVVVCERVNAMHWRSPEKLQLISIDVGWTAQEQIIPAASQNLAEDGIILSLLKPQYEKKFDKNVLSADEVEQVFNEASIYLKSLFAKVASVASPYEGSGGNKEIWFLLAEKLW